MGWGEVGADVGWFFEEVPGSNQQNVYTPPPAVADVGAAFPHGLGSRGSAWPPTAPGGFEHIPVACDVTIFASTTGACLWFYLSFADGAHPRIPSWGDCDGTDCGIQPELDQVC